MSSQPRVDGLELRGADVSRTGSGFPHYRMRNGQVDTIPGRKRVYQELSLGLDRLATKSTFRVSSSLP